MQKCHEWEIEVDQNKQECNLDAQKEFIVSFIGSLYGDIDAHDGAPSKISSLHFTRIFCPERDKMGAYVRLRVLAEECDLAVVRAEIDARLRTTGTDLQVFRVKDAIWDWENPGDEYGGSSLAPMLCDFMASTSRACYELLARKRDAERIETVLWSWTHLFFNTVRGYPCSIVEFAQGAVRQFIPGV